MLLITGAAGYVGTHLLKLFEAEGTEVITPTIEELDLSDFNKLEGFFQTHKIDKILHLAAWLGNDGENLFANNISALYNLAILSKKYGVAHFVFASTNNVYGAYRGEPFVENDRPVPESNNLYGLSKYCGELLLKDIFENSSCALAIVRIGDIYGPDQKTGALLKAVVQNIVDGTPQRLYGCGDRTRDYIYIDDVVKGLKFVAGRQLSGIYNLATGMGTDVRRIIEYAEEISQCKEATISVPTQNEDHSKVILNVEKLKAQGFEAKISLSEGLKKIVEERMKADD